MIWEEIMESFFSFAKKFMWLSGITTTHPAGTGLFCKQIRLWKMRTLFIKKKIWKTKHAYGTQEQVLFLVTLGCPARGFSCLLSRLLPPACLVCSHHRFWLQWRQTVGEEGQRRNGKTSIHGLLRSINCWVDLFLLQKETMKSSCLVPGNAVPFGNRVFADVLKVYGARQSHWSMWGLNQYDRWLDNKRRNQDTQDTHRRDHTTRRWNAMWQ